MGVTVLGYGRVSTADQIISPEVQENHCREWYKSQVGRGEWYGDSKFAGMLFDKAVSGKIDLFKRPQGQHILTTLKRGDVLVVSKLSRAFRSTGDMINTVSALKAVGIRLVLLDIAIDTATPTGKLMLVMLTAIAEFERELIAERTREALQHRIAQGQWMGASPPGWKAKSKKNCATQFERDNNLRLIGQYCAKLLHEGHSPEDIAVEVNVALNKEPSNYFGMKKRKLTSPTKVVYWAVFCVCGWPPVTRKKIVEKFGKNAFTAEFVRKNYPTVPSIS